MNVTTGCKQRVASFLLPWDLCHWTNPLVKSTIWERDRWCRQWYCQQLWRNLTMALTTTWMASAHLSNGIDAWANTLSHSNVVKSPSKRRGHLQGFIPRKNPSLCDKLLHLHHRAAALLGFSLSRVFPLFAIVELWFHFLSCALRDDVA